jgi:hypothetical protein
LRRFLTEPDPQGIGFFFVLREGAIALFAVALILSLSKDEGVPA